MTQPWNLEWENVPSTENGIESEIVQRAAVPGGWLVRHAGGNAVQDGSGRMGGSQEWGIIQWGICFVPDLSSSEMKGESVHE